MSDYSEEIINGYQYNFEAKDKCVNSIMDNENRIEDFGVFDIRYNDTYISYSVLDSLFCENKQINEKTDSLEIKYYIINTKKHSKKGPLSKKYYNFETKRLK